MTNEGGTGHAAGCDIDLFRFESPRTEQAEADAAYARCQRLIEALLPTVGRERVAELQDAVALLDGATRRAAASGMAHLARSVLGDPSIEGFELP